MDVFDFALNPIASINITAQQGMSRVAVIGISPTQTLGSAVIIEFTAVSENISETIVFVQDCSVQGETSTGEPPVLACHGDGRLDLYNCASPITIYISSDDDGWMLQVWWINDEGVGEFLFLLYEEDLPEPGEAPILLATSNGVALYLLPTGE